MSLILDALRKSEAERRRGQAPGLHTGMPLPPAPRASAWRHAPIFAGGALVLVAVALLLSRGQPTEDARGAAATTEVAPSAPGEGALPDDGVEAPAPPRTPPTARAAGTPAAQTAAPPSPSPVAASTPVVPPPAAVPDVTAPPAIPASATAVAAPPASTRPALPADAAPADAVAAPAEDPLPTLAILPPGERAALPTLKLSMHVWNESPARRFAIVDGQRIVEGAQLGNAVVTQIRRDGVELDVNGRRVLLPRP